MEKLEVIKSIQQMLEEHAIAHSKLSAQFEKIRNIEDKINHTIWSSLYPEDIIARLDSYVGCKIQYSTKDYLYIFNVQGIRYDKWEIHLSGDGISYDFSDGTIYTNSFINLRYEDIPECLNQISLASSVSMDSIITAIEDKRKSALANAQASVNKNFDTLLKNLRLDEKPIKKTIMLNMLDEEDPLRNISYFSMATLMERLGIDTKPATLKDVDVSNGESHEI